MSVSGYIVVVEIVVRPELGSAFMPLLLANAAQSLAQEPGCMVFDVCRASDDANRLLLYEVYVDAGAFEAHLKSPHFLSFDAASSAMMASKQVRVFDQLVHGGPK